MNSQDRRRTDEPFDQWVSRQLHDAVDDVEPSNRLGALKRATSGQRPTRAKAPRRHPRWWAVGGAVAAVVCVTAVVTVAVNSSDNRTPTATDSGSADDPSLAVDPSAGDSPAMDQVALPVYYVGRAAGGDRLFREFQQASTNDAIGSAIQRSLTGSPNDPDYRSLWPSDVAVQRARVHGGRIVVELVGNGSLDEAGSLTSGEAELALQQLVYTAQAAAGEGRLPVKVRVADSPGSSVLGLPLRGTLRQADPMTTLNLISLSSPSQGQPVDGDTLQVDGAASSFEASVSWEITRDDEKVAEGYTTAESGDPGRLSPFQTEIDVSDLEPGEYTLTVSTDDPTGGAEGNGPDTDDRTFVIE